MVVLINAASDYLIDEDDIPFEEEILRHTFNIPSWIRYIDHKISKKCSLPAVFTIYERALKHLPGSYKLWNAYLKLRRHFVREKCITDPAYELCNDAHERALIYMHKMPRIWIEYCKFMIFQRLVTATRRLFDRALCALPLTQHNRIWPLYIDFIQMHNIPDTGVVVFRRYLKMYPEHVEDYISYLIKYDRLDEAVKQLIKIVNKPDFKSKHGKSNHQLWFELCELICKNPDKIQTVEVAHIIKNGLHKFTDGLGQLWCSLGDYYIRCGLFEKARDVYEEGMNTVMTVKDFGQVFDAYSQFMDSAICLNIQKIEKKKNRMDEIDLELLMERYEDLMDRRPLLINSVLLRQNKHNVNEWLKRTQLYDGRPFDIIRTFTVAVQTVDPSMAVGHPYLLWTEFAKFYENNKQLSEARAVYEKGVLSPYKVVDDLSNLWCEYTEMELRHGNFNEALRVIRKATAIPSKKITVDYHDDKFSAQNRVHKSVKLWSLYADLEESFGTFETMKATYDKIISMKIASPQIILNFGHLLENKRFFEESFKAYEQGVHLFKWPHVNEIWNTYLIKFIDRFDSSKLERTRDLFEQCIQDCPSEFCFPFYILYAKFEEDFGLGRRAMKIYERACDAVSADMLFKMYTIYINRACEMYGITHTRDIIEKALDVLNDNEARAISLEYAFIETKLGEIDRARAIYSYASQISDPKLCEQYWKTWHDFEVTYGNEETFREMRRIKRTIEAKYSIQPNLTSAHMATVAEPTTGTAMETLEKEIEEQNLQDQISKVSVNPSTIPFVPKPKIISFVKSSAQQEIKKATPALIGNPDIIDFGLDDPSKQQTDTTDDIDTILEKPVPLEVFGGIEKKVRDDDSDEEKMK